MARNPPQIFTTDVPQVASMANLECNRTVKTMMVWFAYEVGSLFTTRIHCLHLTGWVDQRWQWNGGKVVRNSGFQSSWCRVCHQHKWLKTIFLDQRNCSKLHVKPDQHTWTHPELWPSQTSVQIWSWNRWKNDLISDGKIGLIQIIFLLSNILLP